MAKDTKVMWRHDVDNTRIVHSVRRPLGMTRVEYHCGKTEDVRSLKSEPPGQLDHGCESCARERQG